MRTGLFGTLKSKNLIQRSINKMTADPTIYDRIWQADDNRFSVSVHDDEGNW